MSDTQQLPISIQPVISYPLQAEVGKTYLMEIDLKQTDDGEKWTYEEEEYPIYCRLDTFSDSRGDNTPLFKIKTIGEPAVVLHRFGGTYGAAKFLLTAASKEMKGEIIVTLVNGWDVILKRLPLKDISVTQEKDKKPIVPFDNTDNTIVVPSKTPKLESFQFEAKVATIVFENEKLNTILLVEDKPEVIPQISELLSSHYGITVKGTEDVNEIIKLAESSEIDLILSNYDLPNSFYEGKIYNGIQIVDLLRANPNISRYLPIIGFSVLMSTEKEFLDHADGFYYRNKALNKESEQDFINYLRKIYNRVKLLELLPYESKDDLDSVLDLISKRHLEGSDTSEDDVSSLWNKPKGDVGTFYLLENLRLLDVLVMIASGKGLGAVRYQLSSNYLNQNSPRLYSPPDNEKFDQKFQQLPLGQQELVEFIKERSEKEQDTSLADAALPHPQEEDVVTYRRLENLRLLGFLNITDLGTSKETIRYNLTPKCLQDLDLEKVVELRAFEFETVTVNRRGNILTQKTISTRYFTEDLGKDIPLDLVTIPGGTFIMGTEDKEIERLTKKFGDYFKYESPQHEVTVQPFYMSKYPITQRQWKAIAERTDLKVNEDLEPLPSYFKENPQSFAFPSTRGNLDLPYYRDNPSYLDRPVERVNWYQAKEFCDRLSLLTGKEYRLPTEAEWEYACREVINSQSSLINEKLRIEEWNRKYHQPFHFGKTITSDLANYNGKNIYADEPKGVYRGETTPVGMFPPNAFGLYDMHGNVWEWCQDDWHGNYEGAPTDGSPWLDDNEVENINNENESNSDKNEQKKNYTVLRGGSWIDDPGNCRSATRSDYTRAILNYLIGFRVVCVFGRTL